jgi:hypothetical protein
MNDADTEFWDVHVELEVDHGGWVVDALTVLETDPTDVEDSAQRAADLWWRFLDERQAHPSNVEWAYESSSSPVRVWRR